MLAEPRAEEVNSKIILGVGWRGELCTLVRLSNYITFLYFWMFLAEFSQILQVNSLLINYVEITALSIATLSVNLKKT